MATPRKPYPLSPKPTPPKKPSDIWPAGSDVISASEKFHYLPGFGEEDHEEERLAEMEEEGHKEWDMQYSIPMTKVLKAMDEAGLTAKDCYITLSVAEEWVATSVVSKKAFPKNKKQKKQDADNYKWELKYHKEKMEQWEEWKATHDKELLEFNKAEQKRLEKEIKELERSD
jgi:hypothetical protein